MSLFILQETSAGYALLKAKDKKLFKREKFPEDGSTAEGASNLSSKVLLQLWRRPLPSPRARSPPRLASLLDGIKDEKKASLAVADSKLGNSISKLPGLSLELIADSTTQDAFRAIRENLTTLIPTLAPSDMSTMALGLSHSLARHKLKFSPDKIDTMIVQAIGLLDDMDKELNTYAMRVKEWYGWHFPELAKILNDNIAYARLVLKMGMRTNWETADLSEILPEEIEGAVKSAADRSMGTEISENDLENIQALAHEVVALYEYRAQLSSYLSARMNAIAPNLTALVGELVGARLISHAGSLTSLSKSPASTLQILGAEKALFRALKTKHDTPKYGLIYHASLIGQATGRNKGKMARVLAAKASLGLRIDALAEWDADEGEEEKSAFGNKSRFDLERKLAGMEGKPIKPKGKFDLKEARKYNPDADALDSEEPAAPTKSKKDKKKDKKLVEEVKEDEDMADADSSSESDEESSDGQSELEKQAAKAGLSVKRYQRKLERGEIIFDASGNPTAISKKDLKKAKKDAKKAEKEDGKKRKRSDDADEEKKKKKKKSKGE
ncbi:Nucleolar protein 58 [Penicillium chermesinum]|uniref:Nucleolar protein 58 n=1 Tax=Penicillium chermesinum TaxID=63820 RepID=A0A9W9TST2_9EURO|nr:Nucleolar protein 58 [Penicillium chermesinum]KAJ5240085.1 Nucleolar protein 58 [Penicillium chermesinum]